MDKQENNESNWKKKQSKEERKFNQEQYNMLKHCSDKRDITDWNQWREEHRDVEIVLEKARLEGAYLIGVHLEKADLVGANLEGADLGGANLEKANLVGANLKGASLNQANLEGADLNQSHLENAQLFGANLKDASLKQANLEGAYPGGANLEGAYLFEANLEGAYLGITNLKGADLGGAHLEKANLVGANLKEANLGGAHLEGAFLKQTHLEGACLVEAYLRGTNFSDAFLQGTNCRKAIVDGETLIWGCKINKRGIKEKNYTDFSGVGLSSARVQPYIKQLLEYNIRKSNWSLWYNRHWNQNWFTKIISIPFILMKWILVQPFWFVSDYGLSTMRILLTFLLFVLSYAVVYFYYPDCVYIYGENNSFSSFLHSIYFSVVTMTTLGFGDISANPESTLGLILLMSQVILGYILLGALVTRFAVLFTAGGPEGTFSK